MANESRVIITADSAQAIREFNRLRTQSTSSLKDIAAVSDKVGAALGAIGLGTGLAAIVSMSDEYAKFTAQLRLATVSQNEYNAAYADVKRIANASQQAMAATGTLYARIANGTRELGTTQKQVAEITETVNMALKVSGATATESASAQLQLSQAFASGTLRGEEFNAVNEAAPRLMKALADGMGLPIGALKGMAGEGKITSKIMAEVLPNALVALREEGKKVATIGGAFTVLKNEFMEFTAIKAQANGTVNILTTSIKLLSDNINVLFAVTAGMLTLKLTGYFFTGVAAVQAYFAANAELAALLVVERAALISKAQALVASTTVVAASTSAKLVETQATLAGLVAQKTALLAAREMVFAQYNQAKANIASAEAAIAAASSAGALSFALRVVRASTLDLAVAEQARTVALAELTASSIALGRVSAGLTTATASVTAAQAADTAATSARTAATAGLNGAIGRTVVTAGLASKALGFLGGPIGIITTLLSVGAAAWVLWGSKGSEAEKAVTATLASEIDEYLENLNKQIEKLKERNELAGKKMTTGAAPVTENEKKREKILAEINSIGKRVDLDSAAKNALMALWGGKLNKLDVDAEIFDAVQAKNKAFTRDADIKTWLGENGSAAQKMAAELDGLRMKFGELTPEMEKIVRAKYEDKGTATALKKEQSAYDSLIASIRTKTAENTLEAKTDQNATESQKMRIKLDEVLGTGKRALSAAHRELAKNAIAELAASEAALKAREQEKDVQDSLLESTTARGASTAALAAEYAMYGKSSDARAIEMIAVKAQTDQEKFLLDAKIKGRIVTGDQIKALTAEKDARVLVEQATLAQTTALNYAAGLKVDNEKFSAESIADPKARADALLKIDADIWRDRIALAGAGTEAQKLLQTEFNTWYANQSIKVVLDVDVTRATEVLKILESMDAAARSAASGMADSFGSVGEAIGGLTTALSGYAVQQQAIAAQLAASIGDAKGNSVKIAQAQAIAARQGAQAQVKSYGDMASAAKGFFKENSTGYKVMEGAEKAYRAVEMAMAIESMVKKLFAVEVVTTATLGAEAAKAVAVQAGTATQLAADTVKGTSAAAVAVATQAQGDPYSAWIRMAAMAAAMAALGFAVSGGGRSDTTARDRQAATGTGSILGDSSAKSESIAHSLAIMEKNSGLGLVHTISMDASLKQMVSGIGNLGNLLARSGITAAGAGATAGIATGSTPTLGKVGQGVLTGAATYGGAVLGGSIAGAMTMGTIGSSLTMMGAVAGPIGMAIGAAIGFVVSKLIKTSVSVKDSGITGAATSLGNVDSLGFNAQAYADINVKKKAFGISYSSKDSTQVAALSTEMNQQFSMIISSMGNTIRSAAEVLGMGGDVFNAKLNTFVVDLGKISLKGLTGEEQQKALETAFSKMGDDMAKFGVGGLQQYQAVGEGYLETLVRVTNDYMQVSDVLAVLGKSFNTTGVGAVALSESLISTAGGLEALTTNTGYFVQNFLSEAEQMAPITKSVQQAMAALGQSGVTTSEQFKALVLAQDLNTAAGQAMYAQLIAIAEPFKKAADYAAELAAATGDLAAVNKTASEIANERKDLLQQLNELTKTETALLAIQRAGIADVNKALFDQVQAAKAVVSAKDALGKAYDREAAASQTALDKAKSWMANLIGMNASMALGSQSILTPEQKYAEARAQFEKTLAAANAGDTTAQSGLSAAEQAFLTASQVVNASDARYAADYARVVAANDEALKWASAQVDVQQASLDALKAQVSGLITINDSVLTVAQAIANLHAAMGAATGLGVEFTNAPAVAAQAAFSSAPVPLVFDTARYSAGSNAGSDALVAEIRGLRDDNKKLNEKIDKLNADANKNAGAQIASNYDANKQAAKEIVAGVDKSSKSAVWNRKVEYEA
nr:tape measure protein [uncultured Janthinobacterium sp.]